MEKKRVLNVELWKYQVMKESMLAQKSRSKWLKEGDHNSRYFHAAINKRRRNNCLKGIFVNDRLVEEPRQVKEEVMKFFQNRFNEESWNRPTLDGVTFNMISRVDAANLEAPFSEEEIKMAVWDCGGNKSPGPDGIYFNFIKKFWGIIKQDICNALQDFYCTGTFSVGSNASFLALIPKCENPQGLDEYRPISLVGCLYKIIAKVLSRRLGSVMNKIISEEQFAFVEDRFMLDGIVVANEIVHEAKLKNKPTFIFKVDFEKAYDSVSWEFLQNMMRRMGFTDRWRKWIDGCLKSATVSVLINGSPSQQFSMKRGLRQGDPLAPFLFLIVAQGFAELMENAARLQLFEGVKVGRLNVEVSHLQFADDTLVIGKSTLNNVLVIKSILRWFELCSGLKVNFHKSKLAGLGMFEMEKNSFARILNCNLMEIPFVYLGIPVGANPKKESTWKPISDKFLKKLSLWKQKNISLSGRICLINSVLTSLPLFFLVFFQNSKMCS